MSGFQPNSEQHAIIEAVFSLRFDRAFNKQDFTLIDGARDEWPFLPARQEIKPQGLGISIADAADSAPLSSQQFTPPTVGLEYARMRPDATHEWLMRVQHDYIIISCRAYTRWGKIWSAVAKNLHNVCRALPSGHSINLKGASLIYNDRFNWKGELNSYDLRLLFKENSKYPIPNSFGLQPLWHCHIGWFEDAPFTPSGRLLTRLHANGHQDDNGAYALIMTEQELTLDTPMDVTSVFDDAASGEGSPIDQWMNRLHDRDKDILNSILTDEQVTKISLWEKERDA